MTTTTLQMIAKHQAAIVGPTIKAFAPATSYPHATINDVTDLLTRTFLRQHHTVVPRFLLDLGLFRNSCPTSHSSLQSVLYLSLSATQNSADVSQITEK
jgi:hypothetical protein